jgi:hypothetical protein
MPNGGSLGLDKDTQMLSLRRSDYSFSFIRVTALILNSPLNPFSIT